jgi:phosphoribosylformimino-5-aminoimidazole carboxamide ribonucleotide (ProFAR) isomerase
MVQLIPAIDLMSCKIVRLTRGEEETAKFYDQFGTPLEAAKRWRDEGAGKLHIIDLDAAFGNGNNYQVIAEIARNISLPIQVGGGIRNFDTAVKLLKMGVSQVILGTMAFNKTEAIGQIQKDSGAESVIVSLDHENGCVKTHGWTKSKGNIELDTNARLRKTTRKITVVKKISVIKAIEKFTDLGVHRFLITSIAKDGMLLGPDLETLSEAVRFPGVRIIAAGGIGNISDLAALKRVGVEGAVIGKALYEGRFTLKQAIEMVGA